MKAEKGNLLAQNFTEILKTEFIGNVKLGVATGEGFYSYPNPKYESPDFLQ